MRLAEPAARRSFVLIVLIVVANVCATVACAAAAAPGGVTGELVWFTGAGYNGTKWTDQSGSGSVSSQPTAPSGATSPTALSQDANFYPGVSFNGSNQWLRGTAAGSGLDSANTYIFAVSNWNGSIAPTPDGNSTFGGLIGGWYSCSGGNCDGSQGLIFYPAGGDYQADASFDSANGPFSVPTSGSTPYILTTVRYPNASLTGATVYQNAISSAASTSSAFVVPDSQFELGGRTVGGYTNRIWAGTIDEIIVYQGTALSTTQISEIRSYLAVKYGITLGFNTNSASSTGTDYLSSAGTTVWSGAANAAYQYDVAGIAKDSTSGLDQRVAHSVNPTPSPNALDVTIANGNSITTSSQTAGTALGSDQTYVMWGDNNGSTTMSMQSGVYRMGRVWRTQTTGSGSTNLTVRVPSSSLGSVPYLSIFVAADANFQTSVTHTLMSCASGYCTATIPTFSSSSTQYFTFGAPSPSVGVVMSVSPTGLQPPGTVLTYTGTFTNGGAAPAQQLALVDPIPSNTDFQVNSANVSAGSTGLTATISYSSDSGSTWTYTPTSGAGGASTGYDRSVTNVKFTFSGSLSQTSPNNTGSFSLSVRIR